MEKVRYENINGMISPVLFMTVLVQSLDTVMQSFVSLKLGACHNVTKCEVMAEF